MNVSPTTVGVNLLWLRPGAVGGSEHYVVSILRELASRPDPGVTVRLYALPEFVTAYPDIADTFDTTTAPVRGGIRFARVLVENLWLERRMRRDGVDVVHHAGGTMPRRSGPSPVLVLHDLQYLDHPEYFGPIKLRWLRFVVPRSARRAVAIVTASSHSQRRIIDALGVPESRVTKLPHAIRPPESSGTHASPVSLDHFVFFPAWTHPHKNHTTLLRALAATTDMHLVLTGGRGAAHDDVEQLVGELGLGDRVHILGHVSGPEVDALYEQCDALVFPSRYEGFGAPVAEAMVRGVPVISSNTTSLPEVVADGGVLLDPDDPVAWSAAIEALAVDGAELSRRARERSAAFAPGPIVDELVALWRRSAA